jgi:2'-5' RNA ligase
MKRLFIALPLPEPVEKNLGQLIVLCRKQGGHVKWVASENIHLTARFLGDTDEATIPRIKEEINEVAGQFSSVETIINKLGGFPSLKRPRVIWAGIGDRTEQLTRIAEQIELRMRKLRFEPEKKSFRAHLTIGRVRRPQDLEQLSNFLQNYTLEPIPLLFDRLCLFQSTLTSSGPIYECLHEPLLSSERFEG